MKIQSDHTTMWFDRRLVFRQSTIHGVGTFTTEDIAAGELLMLVVGGLIYTTEEQQSGQLRLAPDMYNEAELEPDLFIVNPKVFNYYINYSCGANAVDISRRPNATQYVALRDIRADEEVTADYYDITTLEQCSCGAPECRWAATTP